MPPMVPIPRTSGAEAMLRVGLPDDASRLECVTPADRIRQQCGRIQSQCLRAEHRHPPVPVAGDFAGLRCETTVSIPKDGLRSGEVGRRVRG